MVSPQRMLRHLVMSLSLTSVCVPQATPADGIRFIELTDGSVISGRIVNYEDGVYTVASPSLGRLRLKDAEILSISSDRGSARAMESSPRTPGAGRTGESLAGIERQILGNPEVFALVMSLQQDPQIMEILNDPAIMRAIAARDMEKLRNNPKIRKLERNPTIRKILGRMNQ